MSLLRWKLSWAALYGTICLPSLLLTSFMIVNYIVRSGRPQTEKHAFELGFSTLKHSEI